MTPKSCFAYYYGGLPFKGTRRKGRLWIEGDGLRFEVPKGRGDEGFDLRISFNRMEGIFLTRDNYYGADTVLFNLTFRDQTERPYTLRFVPITIVPRRRIALQKEWFDYLAHAIKPAGTPSPRSTR